MSGPDDLLADGNSRNRTDPRLALCQIQGLRLEAARLDNSSLEKALGPGAGQQGRHVLTAGAFTKDCHPAGVAAEGRTVLLNPFQGADLVEGPEIGRSIFRDGAAVP